MTFHTMSRYIPPGSTPPTGGPKFVTTQRTMRAIETHKATPHETIEVLSFGPTSYEVNTIEHETYPAGGSTVIHRTLAIEFMCAGNPAGVTMESLLAVVGDRLSILQGGPFANNDNAEAIYHIKQAMRALKSRTRRRMAEGKAGTQTP